MEKTKNITEDTDILELSIQDHNIEEVIISK